MSNTFQMNVCFPGGDPKQGVKYANQCVQRGMSATSRLLLGGKDMAMNDAHLALGAAYRHGLGVEKDTAKAEEHLRLAARGGSMIAQNNLASLIAELPGRREEALQWYVAQRADGCDCACLAGSME